MRITRIVALALAVAAVCRTTAASARESARLVFVRAEGAEGCPDEEAVRAAVAVRLGYDPFVAYGRKTVFARVKREKGGFRTELRVIDGEGIERGARELLTAGGDCKQSIGAMALTISIAVDPMSVMPEAAPPPEPPAPAPPEPAREERVPPPPPADVHDDAASPAEPAREPRAAGVVPFVGAGVGATVGRAPAPSAGGMIFAGVQRRSLSLALEGRGDLSASSSSSEGGRVASHAWLASVVACGHLRIPFLCATVGAGTVMATSTGVSGRRSDDALLTLAGIRAGVLFPIGARVGLRAYADAFAVLRPYRFAINGVAVYASPRVSADSNLAVEVHFE